ncbi:MAG: hypothetical protein MUC99_03955 [Anaerolineae bacterium]|jgi:hypothetical protein|nr:hypothetical protein [Anaerolineae bacterium]
MSDGVPSPTPADRKRLIRRRVWGAFALGLLMAGVGGLVVALQTPLQVGVVSDVMTLALCLAPAVLILLPVWLLVGLAIYGVGRLEVRVTRQLAALGVRSSDAQTRARLAARTVGQSVIRATLTVERFGERLRVRRQRPTAGTWEDEDSDEQ